MNHSHYDACVVDVNCISVFSLRDDAHKPYERGQGAVEAVRAELVSRLTIHNEGAA